MSTHPRIPFTHFPVFAHNPVCCHCASHNPPFRATFLSHNPVAAGPAGGGSASEGKGREQGGSCSGLSQSHNPGASRQGGGWWCKGTRCGVLPLPCPPTVALFWLCQSTMRWRPVLLLLLIARCGAVWYVGLVLRGCGRGMRCCELRAQQTTDPTQAPSARLSLTVLGSF